MQTFRVNGFHFFLDFPQGAGRGEEPLTYFGNHFYPYAGGDAFTSYSNSGSYCSTKGYGVLVDASQYTTVQFVTTQDKNKVDVSEFMPTEVIVKMIRDYNRGAEEVGVGAKVERFGLVLFGRDGDGDGSGGEDLLAAVGRELGRLGARGRAGVDAPGATGAGAAGPDDPDVDSGLDFRLPDWTQRGAIIGLEGGTQAVDEKLEKIYQAGVPVSGVWFQDWSGMVSTAFGDRVDWNWRLNHTWYPNFTDFHRKWRARGVRILTYLNPNLRTEDLPFNAIAPPPNRDSAARRERIATPDDVRKSSLPSMYNQAKDLGFLVALTTNTSTPFVFPSATDDFRFGQLDLSRYEVREWYAYAIVVCNVMLFRHDKYCPNLENGQEPLVWGWMSDFGEYLPVAWASQTVAAASGEEDFSPDDSPLADGADSAVRLRKMAFSLGEHNRYPLQWNRVIAMAVKYVSAKMAENERSASTGKTARADGAPAPPGVLTAPDNKNNSSWSISSEIFPFFRAASLLSPTSLNSFWMGDQMTSFDACDGLQSAAIGALMSTFSGWRNHHTDVGGML